MALELRFAPVPAYGYHVVAHDTSRDVKYSYALVIERGPLFEGAGLAYPQVAVWFDDGAQAVCPDIEAARVVVRSRAELES